MQKINIPQVAEGISVLLDIQYLPPVPYFATILYSDRLCFEVNENFIRQTYRNRCRILTSNGIEDLVIPLKKPQQHIPVSQIRIDNRQKWAIKHWRAIQSAYGKSPWFVHYKTEMEEILLTETELLADFNMGIIRLCLRILGLEKEIEFTEKYNKAAPGNYIDLRSCIHPKKDSLLPEFYTPVPYIQNFGMEFVKSLSVIDLIFNEGPDSLTLLQQTLMPKKP